MKKLLSVLLALTLVLGMASFAMAQEETYELALVTDIGTIDDKSFNQGAWEGLVRYAEEFSVSHKYYQPLEKSTDAYLDQIELAVDAGAKVIVTPGFLFEEPIYIAQDMYPDVHFILLDGEPHSAAYEYRTNANVAAILYAEEQSGFLAGYAAVKGGFTKLGFMGGMAVPAVVRFGYGFVQGAEYAAKEMGVAEVTVNYFYTGGFDATPEAQALASAWYSDGVEVIFGCGGSVGNSVMAAAEGMENKWVIGVDKDQSPESATVITSAAKSLAPSVYQTLVQFYNGEFPGGATTVKSAANEGVSLPMESTHIEGFTQEVYDALYQQLAAGEIVLLKDADAASADALGTEIVKVTVIQ